MCENLFFLFLHFHIQPVFNFVYFFTLTSHSQSSFMTVHCPTLKPTHDQQISQRIIQLKPGWGSVDHSNESNIHMSALYLNCPGLVPNYFWKPRAFERVTNEANIFFCLDESEWPQVCLLAKRHQLTSVLLLRSNSTILSHYEIMRVGVWCVACSRDHFQMLNQKNQQNKHNDVSHPKILVWQWLWNLQENLSIWQILFLLGKVKWILSFMNSLALRWLTAFSLHHWNHTMQRNLLKDLNH